MNLPSCSSKMDYTNKFGIPKLSENSQVHISNLTSDDRKNYQVTLLLWKIHKSHWQTMSIWNLMNLHTCLSKTDYTNY